MPPPLQGQTQPSKDGVDQGLPQAQGQGAQQWSHLRVWEEEERASALQQEPLRDHRAGDAADRADQGPEGEEVLEEQDVAGPGEEGRRQREGAGETPFPHLGCECEARGRNEHERQEGAGREEEESVESEGVRAGHGGVVSIDWLIDNYTLNWS